MNMKHIGNMHIETKKLTQKYFPIWRKFAVHINRVTKYGKLTIYNIITLLSYSYIKISIDNQFRD